MMTAYGDEAFRFSIDGEDRVALLEALRAVPGVMDVVLTETVGCVWPRTGRALEAILEMLAAPLPKRAGLTRQHVVDVVYDGEDLETVAASLRISKDALVNLHSDREYTVAMLGFLPGFAYLRGLPAELELPRRAPRTRVPQNSLALAAGYTGIYPQQSPGGWHLLGEAIDFDAFGVNGATFALGDRVHFRPVSERPAPHRTKSSPPPVDGPHLEITKQAGLALRMTGGWPGHAFEGVPRGGPLVRSAFARSNAHVGNPLDACAIELAGILELAARGGDFTVATDEGRVVELRDGETLELRSGADRVRYVSAAGGFEPPSMFEAPLHKGDRIEIEETSALGTSAPLSIPAPAEIEILEGPDLVSGFDLRMLRDVRISPSSNRVGLRLEHPSFDLDAKMLSRPSTPMVLGAIELTPSGLIVMGPDHPTTGGYPVVGVVRQHSHDTLFARPLGSTVRFAIG